MVKLNPNSQEISVNLVGSSTFGRDPNISIEKTYNMFISDGWLVPTPGYKTVLESSSLGNALHGRASFTSIKLNKMIHVMDNRVYEMTIFFDRRTNQHKAILPILIGELQTSIGQVWIAENNKSQILFSDNSSLYIYDATQPIPFKKVNTNFIPGYISFINGYFICAPLQDLFTGTNNTWRLSALNDGLVWADDAYSIGALQAKADSVQAVVPIPGKQNYVLVMGKYVTQLWVNAPGQLFPFQLSVGTNIDFGCVNPSTISYLGNAVVWLAQNKGSTPTIGYSSGSDFNSISSNDTDGIDYLISNLINSADSQSFIYKKDGHTIYNINFYTDKISLIYDFKTSKFFHVSDEKLSYFKASSLTLYQNQYYFTSKDDGDIYALDTLYSTYNGQEIPRIRTCKNIRRPDQKFMFFSEVGFTLNMGDSEYYDQNMGATYVVDEGKDYVVSQSDFVFVVDENNNYVIDENQDYVIANVATEETTFIIGNDEYSHALPTIFMSYSIDGGESFSSERAYVTNPLAIRRNKINWKRLGRANDLVFKFRFSGFNRFIATGGYTIGRL